MPDEEHVLVHVPDHAARALTLLLTQHRGRPRLEALVQALATGAQLQEETSFAVVIGASTIDGAEGESLDRWGELVNEYRGGLGHEDYRRFIGLRIRVNTEHPSTDAMWEVIDEAIGERSTLTSYLVADGIVYVVESLEFIDAAIVAHTGALARDFRPAAIYAAVVEQEVDGAEIGTVAVPGTTIGTVAVPSPELMGRLIFTGRGRAPDRVATRRP